MQSKNSFVFVLAGLIAIALAACGGFGGDPLEGNSWRLITYGENDLIPGTSVTLSFQDGQLGGSAGCNSYSGSYQVRGEKIEIGLVSITVMACPEPEGVMEQESAYLEFLMAGQSFQLQDGSLSIFSEAGEALVFEPQD